MGLLDIFSHNYPYTDFHELNLDWVIKKIVELDENLKNFINLNTIKYANPILWDITRQYEANTVVIDGATGNAYISIKAVPSGVQINRTEYWTQIYNYQNVIETLREQIAYDEGNTTTATKSYNVNDLVFVSGLLYKVISPMIAGDSFVVGSNIEKVDIELLLSQERSARQQTDTQLQTAIDNEVSAREDMDSQLRTLIDNEVSARSSSDDALAQLIEYNNRYNNVKKFGAVGDGVTDDTIAIRSAINTATVNKLPVYFPPAKYRITSTINIPEGVTLIGKVTDFSDWDDNNDNFSTIIIDTTVNANYPAFTCYYGVTVKYLKFYWRGNVVGQTQLDYGCLFSSTNDTLGTNIMADCTFENLMLQNATRGFYAKTGGRNIFKNIKADVTEYFVLFDEQRDSDYFDTIHIFPFASTTDNVRRDYVKSHCNAFIFKNCDDMHLSNILILTTRRGILTEADSVSSPNDYGAWLECENVSFDMCTEECVYMAFPKYATFNNCRFVGTAGYNSCFFIGAQTQSKVQISNSSFWFANIGVINHGARLLLSNCTCEGDIATLVQENSIVSRTKISNCDLYGNDYYNIPGNAELNGEKAIIGDVTSHDNLIANDINAVQVALPITYQLSILEFKTPDNGYGIININTNGSTPAQTIKFKCNGDFYHIPLISKLFLTQPNVQIIYQPSSVSGGIISDIKIYKVSNKVDTIINEYKEHANTTPAYICSDYSYDDNGYHAVDMTNESLTAGLFKDGSTLFGATRELIVVNGTFKQFLYDT